MTITAFFYELSKLESLNDISSILNISIYRDSLIKWFESYKRKVREENISIKNRNSLMKKSKSKVHHKKLYASRIN